MAIMILGTNEVPKALFSANGNLEFSLDISYEYGNFQTLQQSCETGKRHPQLWMTYAGIAGVAQYSLRHGQLNLVSVWDVYTRLPTEEEMNRDVATFGEQVFGNPISQISPDEPRRPHVFALGEYRIYTRPDRIIASSFITHAFTGNAPQDISDITKKLDPTHTGFSNIVRQRGYHVVNAENGRINYKAFANASDYSQTKLELFGTLEIKEGRMIYNTNQKGVQSIDFTDLMIR